MITDTQLTDYAYLVSARFEAINTRYIQLMAQQIKDIGKLNPSDLHKLQQLARMNSNIAEINRLLAKESGRTIQELQEVYRLSGMSLYDDANDVFRAKEVIQIPFEENMWIQTFLKSMKESTGNTFLNIAHTTTIYDSYRSLVDLAVDSITTGQQDYESVIYDYINNPNLSNLIRSPDGGLRVQYASGRTRRLDSAIRMNVLEGVRQVNNGIRNQIGIEVGADGVEISAHALCAEDHIDIQGRQYSLNSKVIISGKTYEDFNIVNDNLQRKISTCNCKHIIYPIVLGITPPTYTEEELRNYKNNSNQKFKIGDREYTKYQASQLMRNLETEMRYAKDKYIFGTESNNIKLKNQASLRFKKLRTKYNEISTITGLEKKYNRTYVPGYKGIGNPKPDDIVLKPITS